jgi:hypothetical protein
MTFLCLAPWMHGLDLEINHDGFPFHTSYSILISFVLIGLTALIFVVQGYHFRRLSHLTVFILPTLTSTRDRSRLTYTTHYKLPTPSAMIITVRYRWLVMNSTSELQLDTYLDLSYILPRIIVFCHVGGKFKCTYLGWTCESVLQPNVDFYTLIKADADEQIQIKFTLIQKAIFGDTASKYRTRQKVISIQHTYRI